MSFIVQFLMFMAYSVIFGFLVFACIALAVITKDAIIDLFKRD